MSTNRPTGLLPAQSLLRAGRYCILEPLGKGGMGAVYKALDLHLSKRAVAIKEMSQGALSGQELQEAIAFFMREAELLAHLKHASLPHIYEQFEEGGRRYLVMEFIEGETLEQHLTRLQQRGESLPVKQALAIALQICTVLHYLHTHQPPVIFRDLKPSNVMLTTHEQIYLIDFGIARFFKPGQAKDTMALGSPGYAPPEQYRQSTSPRSDIYSLGATLYQMLTGLDPAQTPFHFPPFPTSMPTLERLIRNMVALDEKQRPASIQVVSKALERIARPEQTHPPRALRPAPGTSQSQRASVRPSRLSVHVVVSASTRDQQLWQDIYRQLTALLDGFSDVEISADPVQEPIHAIAEADLILLLLSDDFLAAPACLAAANQALDRLDAQEASVLAVMLRSCDLGQSRLAHIKVVPQDAIAHMSPYAQEQRILETAKLIRRLLITLLMQGRTSGPMDLLHWLLWQLHGNGLATCPYFQIGRRYAIRHLRPSGLAGILTNLLDLQHDRVLGEYLIGPLRCADLTHLLQVIAPGFSDPEGVQGIASRHHPLRHSSLSLP